MPETKPKKTQQNNHTRNHIIEYSGNCMPTVNFIL
uniref:Uncharacterized protein n=1 Tax=Rhizophora mucronata TaxID=61149 RepID=A0A2P2NUU4_RHIMU